MIDQNVTHATVSMLEIPRSGFCQLIMRVLQSDKEAIDRAAAAVGMKQAQFTRTVSIQAARDVLKQLKTGYINPPQINPGGSEVKDGKIVTHIKLEDNEVRIAINGILAGLAVNWNRVERTEVVDEITARIMELNHGQ